MSTAEKTLAVIHGGGLEAFPPAKVEVIRNTVAKKATNDELEMFLHLASRYGLDPFAKEIWFVKRGDDATIMTSRDGYLKIAQNNPDYRGIKSFVVREGDHFEIDATNDTVIHKFGAKRGNIIGAWAMADREGRNPVVCFVEYAEYCDDKSPVWRNYPSAMIQKVAEVFVLKRQFGISGLTSQEEMPDRFVQPNDTQANAAPRPAAPSQDREAWLVAVNELNSYATSVGLTGDELRAKGQQLLGKADPKRWTIEDIFAVRHHLENVVGKTIDTTASEGDFELPSDEELPF